MYEQELNWTRAWARAGFVTLKEQAVDMLGVIRKIDVEPTKEGLAARILDPKNVGWLRFVMQTTTVDRIARNEAVHHGADVLREVWFTATDVPTEVTKKYVKALGGTAEPAKQWKGRALIEYDPFTQQWKLGPMDQADIDADFTTDFVAQALK